MARYSKRLNILDKVFNALLYVGIVIIIFLVNIIEKFRGEPFISHDYEFLRAFIFGAFFLFLSFVINTALNQVFLKEYNELQTILFDKCDIKQYLDEHSQYLQRVKNYSVTAFIIRINQIVGLMLYGDLDETGRMIEDIRLHIDKINKSPYLLGVYYCNVADYNMKTNNMGHVIEYLDLAKEALAKIKPTFKGYDSLLISIARTEAEFAIETGDCEKAIEYFTNDFQGNVSKRIHRVTDMWYLAKAYNQLQDKEQYIKCLDYVAQYGGSLYITNIAKELLSQ